MKEREIVTIFHKFLFFIIKNFRSYSSCINIFSLYSTINHLLACVCVNGTQVFKYRCDLPEIS